MKNPISQITEIIKDPVELTSITFPSAALVAVGFAYREQIHPSLKVLPDPLAGDPIGGVLFLVATLIFSLVIKRVSHDLLNWAYDKFYRDRKRKGEKTWYYRAEDAGILTTDPMKSKYADALDKLKKGKNPIINQVTINEIQSKLARSVSLILFLIASIVFIGSNWVLAIVSFCFSLFMWYTFCKFRWAASELIYEATLEN